MRKYNFTNIIAFQLHRIETDADFIQLINTERYNESTEQIYAVNILPLARFESTTMAIYIYIVRCGNLNSFQAVALYVN